MTTDGSGGRRVWPAVLRAALRFGLPLAGLVVIVRATVASIGGDIEGWRFALGVLLILLSLTARLVPKR